MAEDKDTGVWRDEERLPLRDLVAAVAVSAADGQVDDVAGNDAGIQECLDELQAEQEREGDHDPDPTSAEGRALRTDFTGLTGPH
ncbi:hypothetical protein ACQP2P_21260 [Dactylosporangium sp. CA-139114]|uniref:hypothetical protein n=1 Tax=Dactylosporangium sp. CA-139114 TaxID=3239931 RepID=UPI003D96D4F8